MCLKIRMLEDVLNDTCVIRRVVMKHIDSCIISEVITITHHQWTMNIFPVQCG